MGERKDSDDERDWAADSARSDELAASGPPAEIEAQLAAHSGGTGIAPSSEPTVALPKGSAEGRQHSARSLGKYRFIATLGRGGMADVHLAVSVGPAGFSKLQVIKTLRAGFAEEPEFKDMLLDEARLAARLNHRNVVQTNEVGVEGEQYFLAMEYLEGQPLSRVISRARERERPISLAVSLWILCEALAGLHYAHELCDYDGTPLNVVHRDVSPHNIFVTYDGQVKVVDFGIALAARRIVETQAGTLKGKIAYMAPEQAFSPSSEIDRRADVFSVGVILWEMVAGRRLWRGLSDPQIISRLMREIPDVRTARQETPFELASICAQALERNPDDRYTTAAELRAALERYRERLGEQVSAAVVGELLDELFSDEHAEIRGIIDRQLKTLAERAQDTDSDWEYTGRRSSLPPIAPRESMDEEAISTAVSRGARSNPPPGTLHAVVRPEPPRSRSQGPLIVASVAAATVAVAIVVTQLRGSSGGGATQQEHGALTSAPATQAPVTPSAPGGETAPAAPAAPSGAFLRARIKVNPAEAKILIDSSELPSNPFEGKLLKDGAAHRIEMQAPGFNAQRRMVVFDKDIDIDVTLFPSAAPAPTRTAAPAEAPSQPSDVASPPPKPDPY